MLCVSHLTYLVLGHYLAKEETQKAAQGRIVRALDFLSPELCAPRPKKPRAEHIDCKT